MDLQPIGVDRLPASTSPVAGSSQRRNGRLVLIAMTLASVAALACHDGFSPFGLFGTYGLTTVNGKPVPATLFSDTSFTDVVAGGSLSLTPDGKYLSAVTTNETVDGHLSVYVDTVTGTWRQSGGALTLTAVDSSQTAANWNGNSVTVTDSSGASVVIMVFSRR